MATYSKRTQQKVEQIMHEWKKGTLKTGKSDKKVKSQKQAVAIALDEARRQGDKTPPKSGRQRKHP